MDSKKNPGVEVLKKLPEAASVPRKISELNKPCDVFASADYMVIDQLLIPEHADWNLKFATNEMTIVYTEKSRRAKEINQKIGMRYCLIKIFWWEEPIRTQIHVATERY